MAVINIDDAYILGETGAQVDKVTGLFTKDEGTTSGEKAFAQLNIGTAGSNRNLLDNPWFTVNQRGITSGTSNEYPADRWVATYGSGGMTWVRNADGSITATPTNTSNHADICQVLEQSLAAWLDGKTVTVSVLLADGTILSGTNMFSTTGNRTFVSETVGSGRVDVTWIYANRFFRIQNWYAGTAVRAVKLELGTVSTLANDAPPDYGEELAKCMRYFIRIKGDPIGSGYVTAGLNQAYIHIPTPVPMRTAPTASINGSMYIRGTGATWNVSTVTVPSTSLQPTNGVSVIAAVSATQVMAVGAYMSSANSYIDLTADL